jgi:hypothetical protein
MKKLLLTLATVAMCGFASYAAETTLEVKDATDIKGTDVPEKPAEGTSNGQARHIQPLESLKLGDYSFTFTQGENKNTAPAYYYSMTGKPDVRTIRLYANNTMTITAPAGKEFASVKAYQGTTETVVYNGEKATTCTFTATATVKWDKFVISTEAGETPNPPAGDITVKKATEVAAGEVAFVFNEGYVETFAADKAFGYWMAVAATPADEMKVSKEAIFTLASTDKGYTIKDCNNRFMGWDGQHWSFNAYTTADEGNCYWTVTMVDGKVKIANTEKYVEEGKDPVEVYLAGKAYNSDYEMCPTSFENKPLPLLYVKGEGSGVANIAVENNGEAVYYNLQGVRVENPVKGLYIVVKGGKSQKVML